MNRLVVMACVVMMTWGAAHAQPLAERLPAGAKLYIGWAGTDSLTDAYNASKFKAVYGEQLSRQGSMGELFKSFAPVMAEEEPELAQLLPSFGEILDHAIQYPGAIALDLQPTPDGEPMPSFAWIIQAGPDADTVAQHINQLISAHRRGIRRRHPPAGHQRKRRRLDHPRHAPRDRPRQLPRRPPRFQ